MTATQEAATETESKTQHFGYALVNGEVRPARPAATAETARERALKIGEKAGAGVVPTVVIEATTREEARAQAAEALLMEVVGNEDAEADTDDDLAPTDSELAEAAAAREAAESPEARAAAGIVEAARRTGTRSGYYLVAARKNGEIVATQAPQSKAEDALAISVDADWDKATLVAVKASSRDAAINQYEALNGNYPESQILETAVRASGGTRKPRGAVVVPTHPIDLTWEAKEAVDGKYYASKTGLIHSSRECRFVKGKSAESIVITDPDNRQIAQLLAARAAQDASMLPRSDDGTVTVIHFCLFCAGRTVTPEAAPVPSVEDAAAMVDAAEEIEAEDAEADGDDGDEADDA